MPAVEPGQLVPAWQAFLGAQNAERVISVGQTNSYRVPLTPEIASELCRADSVWFQDLNLRPLDPVSLSESIVG